MSRGAGGGRPATGSIEGGWRRNKRTGIVHWHARVTMPDGRREWVPLDRRILETDVEGARRCAVVAATYARDHGAVAESVRETVGEYAKRWLKAREGRVRSVRDNRGHMTSHILPVLQDLDLYGVTREHVAKLVDVLDAKVKSGALSAKTAANVWGTCKKMFSDATFAKQATGLRCLDADPTAGVRGPDDDDAPKMLQFLYPSEFASFIGCADVPVVWRRNAAIALYLCLRDGEQRALKWSAVDLEHGVVTIAETFDRRTGADRDGTKSGAARVVPIRAELLPLLAAMHKRDNGKGYVCTLPSLRDMARGLRRYLMKARVDRPALHKGSSVNKPMRWHDLRASGGTWLAVEGANPTTIRDMLGHTQTSMTDRYIRAAGLLRGGRFGQPFPPLPESIFWGLEVSARFRPVPKLRDENPSKEGVVGGADGTRTRGLRRDRPAL